MRTRLAVGVAALLGGCAPDDGMSSIAETSSAATTAAATSMSVESSSDGASTDDGTSSDTGVPMPPPKPCSLAVIDPTADLAMAVDDGDGDDQIPTVIGEALVRNCGCHYTNNVMLGVYIDYTSNAQPLVTLADFHSDFAGTFPTGFDTMPTYLAVQERVVNEKPLPMPPHGCTVEGEPGRITTADRELFAEWLAAGAPSGAAF